MNEQDKLCDLCARLPYGVIVRHITHKYNYKIDSYRPRAVFEFELSPVSPMSYYYQGCSCHIEDIKPYLRYMSSMTNREIADYHKTMDKYTHRIYPNSADFSEHTEYSWTAETIDWLKSLKDSISSKQGGQSIVWSEEEIEKAAQEWDSKVSVTPFYMTLDGKGSPNGVRQDIMTHKESFKAGINWILKSIKGEKPLGKTALEAAKETKIDNANKVEPKFKVRDWVIDKQGIAHQIANVVENVTSHTWGYDIVDGGYFNDNVEGVRLWTIQDAKNGDVLSDNGEPFIFKGLIDPNHPGNPVAYCGICENYFIVGSGAYDGTNWWCSCKNVQPATKKQCKLLFTKMKEAGYEWDNDKKKLSQIKPV